VSEGPDLSALADELVAAAKGRGVELTGPGGLLTGLSKRVLATALEVEMTDHVDTLTGQLGDRHLAAGLEPTTQSRQLTKLVHPRQRRIAAPLQLYLIRDGKGSERPRHQDPAHPARRPGHDCLLLLGTRRTRSPRDTGPKPMDRTLDKIPMRPNRATSSSACESSRRRTATSYSSTCSASHSARAGLEGYGLEITRRVGMPASANAHNVRYLMAKRDRMGHLIKVVNA
jgi:hypothetical protein